MAAQEALQTMGLYGSKAQAQAQVNDTNDFKIDAGSKAPPASTAGHQLDKGPTQGTNLVSPLPKTGRASFAARKEDPKMIEKVTEKNDIAGTINGMSAFIDGYLRINKRKYGSRGPYGVVSGGYKV